MIAMKSSSVGPPTNDARADWLEDIPYHARGHMIVPFADSRRRSSHSKRSAGVPSSSRRRLICGSRKQTPPDPPEEDYLSDRKARSRKKESKTTNRHAKCHGEDLIVGFPERKPDHPKSKNTKHPDPALRRRSQQRKSSEDWRQASIDWGDDSDTDSYSKIVSLSDASNASSNKSVELDSSARSLLLSFSSLLGSRKNQVANRAA